jgi:uncharacterized protein (AIM24 family)
VFVDETGEDITSTTTENADDDQLLVEVDVETYEVEENYDAEYDSDNDGTNDTAVVTNSDGTTYVFTDADGDGDADIALALEADGDVTVAEHTADEEWVVVEEGHLNSDGGYEQDTTTSGSDAVWAEAK